MKKEIVRLAASIHVLAVTVSFAGIFTSAGFPADSAFFPVAVWLQSPSNAAAYKATGINLFVGLWQGPTQQQLSDCKTAGMPVLCDQNSCALANLNTYGTIIAGWTQGDEPDNAQANGSGGYDPCISPDTIIKFYKGWRSQDSTRPVFLNLGQGVAYTSYIGRGTCTGNTSMYPRYTQGCTIASYDIYPVNSSYAAVAGNLWYVAKGVDSLRQWAGGAKPVWCWIECTRIDSSSPAKPTPAQVKAEVWMALIHGARGFGYFCHSWYGGFQEAGWLSDAPMKNAITAINHRIDTLAPVLNCASLASTVSAYSSNSGVPIDIMVKKRGQCVYIFAVAMRNDTTTAQFAFSSMLGATGVTVLDENRTIGIAIGNATDRFSDHFNGYEAHLYKMSVSTAARPYQATVKKNIPGTPAYYTLRGARLGPGKNARGVMVSVAGRLVRKIFIP